MIELGHFAAFLALAAALAQGMFGLTGQRRMAGLAAYAGFAVMILSFVTLIVAFARSDFSVALVANNSHTLKPMIYKIAGAWGNHEGSMALWCLVTLGFGAAGALWMRTGRDLFEARALGIQGLLAVGALAYLLFASSPFLRLDPAPFQGAGLNPLLQDPALSIHPPMLYLGYVGYSFVFALAAAGLMEARVDSVWAKEARRWSLAAFIPLTLGIALGSYWAYYELGWGGWWFWDPVENASLMPWLIGAALLHSVVVTEKREGFGAWSALLAVLAFLFSIMGAFLVRSGILTSVHAFAVDPERGMLLLFGLLTYGGFALVLFAMRAPKLPGGKPWMLLSREGALMANNIVLIVAALTVLLGTLFPLMAEAAGRTISVETTGRYETTVALAEGGSGTVAGWTLTLDQVRAIEGPNWYADRAQLTATRGSAKAIMTPMKRYYPAAQMPTTETAIHKTGTGDLYAALGEQRMVDGAPRWVFRVYYNPMIDLLYFGVILMALGGAFSLWPRRKA